MVNPVLPQAPVIMRPADSHLAGSATGVLATLMLDASLGAFESRSSFLGGAQPDQNEVPEVGSCLVSFV